MAERTWRFDLEGEPHTLKMMHNWWSNHPVLTLDGEALAATRKRFTSVHKVDLGQGHQGVLDIRMGEHCPGDTYKLEVDGNIVDALPKEGSVRRADRLRWAWNWEAVVAVLIVAIGTSYFLDADVATTQKVRGTLHHCSAGRGWDCQLGYEHAGVMHDVPYKSSFEVDYHPEGETRTVFIDPRNPTRWAQNHGPTERRAGTGLMIGGLVSLLVLLVLLRPAKPRLTAPNHTRAIVTMGVAQAAMGGYVLLNPCWC